MSVYRNQSIPPDQRIGNCCVPYTGGQFDDSTDCQGENPPAFCGSYRVDTHSVECFWNVGVYDGQGNPITDPAEQINDCKAGTGIHYNRDKWELCNVQCGDLMQVHYCNPSTYSCTQDRNQLNPADVAAGTVRTYVDGDTCARECIALVDLDVTVGGACAEGRNIYSVFVSEASTPSNPNRYLYDATVRSLNLQLMITGPNGSPITTMTLDAFEGRSYRNDETVFASYAPQRVSNREVDYVSAQPLIIPAGGFFEGRVEADVLPEGAVGAVSARLQTNAGSTYGSAPLSTAQNCKSLTMTQDCRMSGPGDAPRLSHSFAMALPAASLNARQGVNVQFILDGCHDWATAAIEVPAGCAVSQRDRIITCNFPKVDQSRQGTELPIPPGILFSVDVQPKTAADADGQSCGSKPIGVVAIVNNDGVEMPRTEVREVRIPCGKCDICTEATSEAQCGEPSFRDYCTWDAAFQMCDQRDDVCPRFYGCCFAQDAEVRADGTKVPAQSRYFYGGRDEQSVYDPSQVDFTYALGCVDTARNCERDPSACPRGIRYPFYQVMRHPLSDVSPDPPDTVARRQSDRAYWKDQCEYTESTSSKSATSSSSSEPGAIDFDYFCKNEFSWADYAEIALLGGRLPLKSLPLYTVQPLGEGSVFFSRAYSPVTQSIGTAADFAVAIGLYSAANNITLAAPVEQGKIDGPLVCEESKTVITCCALDGCRSSVALDACLGQPVYPNGLPTDAEGKTLCTRAHEAGLCAPPPANWQMPG